MLVALGQISDLVLGIDVAGTVARVGSNVKHLKVGDRVAFPKPGGMCTVTRVRGDLPQLLPDNMSFEDGATIPLVFMAAYQSLIETAHLSRGERVLIHSAAGGKFDTPSRLILGVYSGCLLTSLQGWDKR